MGQILGARGSHVAHGCARLVLGVDGVVYKRCGRGKNMHSIFDGEFYSTKLIFRPILMKVLLISLSPFVSYSLDMNGKAQYSRKSNWLIKNLLPLAWLLGEWLISWCLLSSKKLYLLS